MVEGTIRAWDALENNVRAQGIEPRNAECLEVKLESGFHLRVAKNHTEARSLSEGGVYIWSIKEIDRVIESEYTLVNLIKETIPGAELENIAETFDFKKGDKLNI